MLEAIGDQLDVLSITTRKLRAELARFVVLSGVEGAE